MGKNNRKNYFLSDLATENDSLLKENNVNVSELVSEYLETISLITIYNKEIKKLQDKIIYFKDRIFSEEKRQLSFLNSLTPEMKQFLKEQKDELPSKLKLLLELKFGRKDLPIDFFIELKLRLNENG